MLLSIGIFLMMGVIVNVLERILKILDERISDD